MTTLLVVRYDPFPTIERDGGHNNDQFGSLPKPHQAEVMRLFSEQVKERYDPNGNSYDTVVPLVREVDDFLSQPREKQLQLIHEMLDLSQATLRRRSRDYPKDITQSDSNPWSPLPNDGHRYNTTAQTQNASGRDRAVHLPPLPYKVGSKQYTFVATSMLRVSVVPSL